MKKKKQPGLMCYSHIDHENPAPKRQEHNTFAENTKDNGNNDNSSGSNMDLLFAMTHDVPNVYLHQQIPA